MESQVFFELGSRDDLRRTEADANCRMDDLVLLRAGNRTARDETEVGTERDRTVRDLRKIVMRFLERQAAQVRTLVDSHAAVGLGMDDVAPTIASHLAIPVEAGLRKPAEQMREAEPFELMTAKVFEMNGMSLRPHGGSIASFRHPFNARRYFRDRMNRNVSPVAFSWRNR